MKTSKKKWKNRKKNELICKKVNYIEHICMKLLKKCDHYSQNKIKSNLT